MPADLPIPAPANWPRLRNTPPPVTVEIITDPPHPTCVASIVLGPDNRSQVPCYSIHIPHQDAVLITLAQLAALMLAARKLLGDGAAAGPLQ